MKKIIVFLCCIAVGGNLYARGISEKTAAAGAEADLSYAVGMLLGNDLEETGLSINYQALLEGIQAVMGKKETRFTPEEAMTRVQIALNEVRAKKGEEARLAEAFWLAENAQKEGIITTESGLQYEVLTEGDGPQPTLDDVVKVHYEGSLVNGSVFDSSYERGEPADFPLRAVIPGWSEAIQLMKKGGSSRFYIPSKLAYGEQGAGPAVPPYSILIFRVELLDIIKQESIEYRVLDEEE